ncbi:interleukin-27 subunit alpha [Mixophyes fleayi]|uniref:interleukin-27 subunit alpha n=1 Tax=Mixophyes fleayi TaxID=3061075 RepID=UPI003F4DFC85
MNTLISGACWLPVLLCGIIRGPLVDGAPTIGGMTQLTDILNDDFNNSLKLSKKLLRETRLLTHDYRLWKLPGAHLAFLAGRSQNVPNVSIDFDSWLKLQPGDRLRLLNEALHVFPVYLDELETWLKGETHGISAHLKVKVPNVRFSLRDLLLHMQRQISSRGVSPPKVLSPTKLPTDGKDWCSRVQMFQALKALEQGLLRAVRDYTMLQSSLG